MNRFWMVVLGVGLFILLFWYPLWTLYSDLRLELNFRFTERWKPYVDQNEMTLLHPDFPLSLCFVTLDTRGDGLEFVKLHNQNFQAYVDHQNKKAHQRTYAYKFTDKCVSDRFKHIHNPYWCKFFLLREILEEDQYDYVFWVDSDTVITDFEVDFAKVLSRFNSHCFVGLDNPDKYDILNAGAVGFRNSSTGRSILRTFTETYNQEGFQNRCVNKQTKALRGWFAHSCFEQGVMNDLLYRKFRDALTVLPAKYILSSKSCEGSFITHMYASSSEHRKNCFRQYVPQ